MSFLVIAIDPVIVRLGPLAVRWYGLMIALAIALGVSLALREARRKGLDEEKAYATALWGVVGAIVGARLFHVVDRLDFYLQNPTLILAVQQGGLAIWGGIIGGLAGGLLYARLSRLPLLPALDAAAPGLLLGQTVGRLGCIINGDAAGGPSTLPWSFVYVHPDALAPELGQPTHPYPVYEMLWNALVLGLLWRLRLRPQADGLVFLTYLSLYALGRFFLTFVRQEQVVLLGLQQAQVISLVVFLVATPLLLWRWWRLARTAPAA